MKRGLVLIAVLLILSSFLIYAQDESNIQKELKNISSEFKNKSKEIIGQDIALSDKLQSFAEIFFKVDRQISFSEFVIMSVIFFFFFIFFLYIFPFVPFLNSGIAKWLGALVVASLVAVSGGLYQGLFWLFGLANTISFLNKLGPAKTFAILLFFAIIFFVLIFILRKLKDKLEKEQAEAEGMEAGAGSRFLTTEAEIIKKGMEQTED